jgi:hypothetical protein
MRISAGASLSFATGLILNQMAYKVGKNTSVRTVPPKVPPIKVYVSVTRRSSSNCIPDACARSVRHRIWTPLSSSKPSVVSSGRPMMCYGSATFCSAIGIQNGPTRWRRCTGTAGVRVVRTPPAAPNCNAHAERFVRSIKEECLDRVLPLGEWHLRRLVREYITHYHADRNHQGIGNALIDCPPPQPAAGPIRRPLNESAGFSATTIVPHRMARS